jgi:hypothetical protein
VTAAAPAFCRYSATLCVKLYATLCNYLFNAVAGHVVVMRKGNRQQAIGNRMVGVRRKITNRRSA